MESSLTVEQRPSKIHSPCLNCSIYLGPWKKLIFQNCIIVFFPHLHPFPTSPAAARVYPKAFAEAISGNFDNLVTGGYNKPAVEPQFGQGNGVRAFESASFTTWDEAELHSVLRYLRGNTKLDAPQYWRNAFPTPFEILNKMESAHLTQPCSSWTWRTPWSTCMILLFW